MLIAEKDEHTTPLSCIKYENTGEKNCKMMCIKCKYKLFLKKVDILTSNSVLSDTAHSWKNNVTPGKWGREQPVILPPSDALYARGDY